jgi:hypothetical protein
VAGIALPEVAAIASDAWATAGARATVACAGNPICATLLGLGGAAGAAAANDVENTGFQLGEGSPLRELHFRPDPNSKWGLTFEHLKKHFFGDGPYSLKQIDPGGATDKWMQHLLDLAQSPVTGKTSNGMLDIIGEFARADGTGMFKMGIRLFDRGNDVFDLVTILTRQ